MPYEGEYCFNCAGAINTVAPGTLSIKAHVSWQECNDICVTGETDVSADLTIGKESEASLDAERLKAAETRLPIADKNLEVITHWEDEAKERPLVLEWTTTNKFADVEFLPYENGTNYEMQGAVERLPNDSGKISIRKLVTKSGADWPKRIEGVLMTKITTNSQPKGFEVTLTPNAAVSAPMVVGGAEDNAARLGLAFLGGLILNIAMMLFAVDRAENFGVRRPGEGIAGAGAGAGLGLWRRRAGVVSGAGRSGDRHSTSAAASSVGVPRFRIRNSGSSLPR